MTDVLIRGSDLDTGTWGRYTPREEGHVMTGAEIGGTQLPAKGCQSPPGAGRGKEGFPPEPSEGDGPADTLTSGFQAAEL